MAQDDIAFDRYQRWRLILGQRVEDQTRAQRQQAGACAAGDATLTDDQQAMDAALGAIYDLEPAGGDGKGKGKGGRKGAGLGRSSPQLAAWLGDVRKYFERDVVQLIQQDAIERKGLRELLFEPETLGQVTPSVELVGTLLALKGMIPEKTKETARQVIQAVVDEIVKRLAPEVERAVRGALDRSRHQPIPSLPNLDWKRTIGRNLGNWIPEKKTLIPERFYFYARQHRRKEWNVIVCMDQSGSMAESVVYGSIMGAIFASIPALESHVVAFDTEVVDLSEHCSDPVDLLFGVQLGGGTDINRAVGYCQGLVHDPRKTLFILITDLYEGGNGREMVRKMAEMVDAGVRAVCLLALSDSGVPSYDERMAKQIAEVGVPSFACTPNRLPEVLEAMLKGGNIATLASKFDSTPAR